MSRTRVWIKRIVIAGLSLALLVSGVIALGLFLPPPDGLERLECTPADGAGCRAASGRVVYIPRKDRSDRSRPLHLVLLSRDSVALPGVTLVKIPVEMRPGPTPGVGTWVSVVGTVHIGSNGQEDIGVNRLRIAD